VRRDAKSDLKSRAALEALERTLFHSSGARRLPPGRELDRVLARVTPEQLFWYCETRPRGPLYLLPTCEFVDRLAAWLAKLAGPRGTIVEVGAGDGFLAASLLEARRSLRLVATDSGLWEWAGARMTPAERRSHGRDRDVHGLRMGPNVVRQEAVLAARTRRAKVLLVSWLPPGRLFEQLMRCPCHFLVEIGTSGDITGQGEWGWRFAHEFAPSRVTRAARSRLDGGKKRRTQVTCYFGRGHPDFAEETPRRGDWLWQFRPR
jgi:hypothetical protein